MMLVIFYILLGIQSGVPAVEETYLKRTAASWSSDLQHQDAKTRRAAAFAMGKLGKHALPYISTLKTLLQQDQEVSVRSAALFRWVSWDRWQHGDIAPVVIQSFEKETQLPVRRALALTLGKVAEQAGSAEPLLRKALVDHDAVLRQNAAWSLGQLG
ncbi:MAG: HEAT repeat domain-containing protein, partial [Gemmatales bacterium]